MQRPSINQERKALAREIERLRQQVRFKQILAAYQERNEKRARRDGQCG